MNTKKQPRKNFSPHHLLLGDNIIMNPMNRIFPITLVILMTSLLTSCAAIEGIFKAGVWSGVIMVVVVVALLIWILAKLFGGNKN
ncbi:hypothetical protein [Sphingobacterium spiritivorum]